MPLSWRRQNHYVTGMQGGGIGQVMANTGFWALAVVLAAVVLAILVLAARRGGTRGLRGAADIVIYKDQLAEIDRDLARGTITADEATRLRGEVGYRLLEADRADGGAAMARNDVAPGGMPWVALGLTAVIVLAGSVFVYDRLGAPGYPDLPLQARLAGLDAAIAARPSQAEELARLGVTDDPALAALRSSLAGEADATALRAAFASRFGAGEIGAAVITSERLLTVLGADATAADHANRALALVAEAQGYVSPEAEAELRAALTLDLTNEVARYLVGEMFLQGGRFDQAFRFWRPLAEDGDPNAPWVASIRERIGMVADLAGIRYELPGAAGPSAGDMAAAAEMSPEDRQAMIEGMVAQLSDRLASDGGSVEDWERLIRSLAVLERLDDAQRIYDEAMLRFEGRPAELSFLRMAAVESGLNP
ncbi:c-type cytochrome biogenesis protein CcmI [Tabrizicola piscis]|uniref:C-type cytochrome biogenesis protein CcmI n=1 Tax=Tabrizicola piscis TaxID=2494374 RepID=A0A3S8UAG6_9RHOB|nr:c-type cytochrome biogenesis protein CcmI [Tabrizicola piscis]AZL60539.1 c-type cytochrome biogenesis protein CcmI [Tabrizicola piscis]